MIKTSLLYSRKPASPNLTRLFCLLGGIINTFKRIASAHGHQGLRVKTILTEYGGFIKEEGILGDFTDLVVGVDVSCWIQACIKSPRTLESFASDFSAQPAVDISQYIVSFFDSRLKFFMNYNITLVLVLDSAQNPLKADTNVSRGKSLMTYRELITEFMKSTHPYDEAELKKILKGLVYPREDVYSALFDWAKLNGVSLLGAPVEADWQLCHLIQNGSIQAIISIDTDIMLLSTGPVIFDIQFDKAFNLKVKNCSVITQDHIAAVRRNFLKSGAAMSQLDLYSLCIFIGNDYLVRLHGNTPFFFPKHFDL